MNDRELIKSLLIAGNFRVEIDEKDKDKVYICNDCDEKTETKTEYGVVEYKYCFTMTKVEFIELVKEADIDYFHFDTSVKLKGIDYYFSFKTVKVPRDKFDDFANKDKIDLNITATINCGYEDNGD